ncbi:hypothetical protein RHMOL_Rhmol07G0281700 [Rhododendron molle]|uniref:Uncharacterized protein n=1 Tax=Rhododendron molle TaxID=49168 RepID=A0ACC0N6V6_RHOML|nr:hypothetical protein RHMOL_Rhmol07G0281700 [Rhododendron molle]
MANLIGIGKLFDEVLQKIVDEISDVKLLFMTYLVLSRFTKVCVTLPCFQRDFRALTTHIRCLAMEVYEELLESIIDKAVRLYTIPTIMCLSTYLLLISHFLSAIRFVSKLGKN